MTVYREKYFHHKDSQAVAQVAHRCCTVAMLGGFKNLAG